MTAEPTVYLAGPMVFYRDPDQTFAQMKSICSRHGLAGVSPLDNQTKLEGQKPGHALADQIVRADIALMHDLDSGIFCLDGFRRSPEMDPGTAFEIGFMHALGKPLVGWTGDPRDYPSRVRDYFADRGEPMPEFEESIGTVAKSGGLRDLDGILVHSEGCYQNAMAQIGIELSGGRVFADLDWSKAFDAAIAKLADMLPRRRPKHRAIA